MAMVRKYPQLVQQLFKVSEVEVLTGWSRFKVYELIWTGKLPATQEGKGKP